jgi:hypothetical protein
VVQKWNTGLRAICYPELQGGVSAHCTTRLQKVHAEFMFNSCTFCLELDAIGETMQ